MIEMCLVGEDCANTILDLSKRCIFYQGPEPCPSGGCSGAVALGLNGGIQACRNARLSDMRGGEIRPRFCFCMFLYDLCPIPSVTAGLKTQLKFDLPQLPTIC